MKLKGKLYFAADDDVPLVAEPRPKRGFVIVHDPEHIFKRGNSFERQDVSHTLWLACWPLGLVMRDLVDNRRYYVVEYMNRSKRSRQRLEALGGDVWLVPTGNNGVLEQVVQTKGGS